MYPKPSVKQEYKVSCSPTVDWLHLYNVSAIVPHETLLSESKTNKNDQLFIEEDSPTNRQFPSQHSKCCLKDKVAAVQYKGFIIRILRTREAVKYYRRTHLYFKLF